MDKIFAAAASAGRPPEITDPLAPQDALAALKLVRRDAARWHVDPARVGMIGFSAGAITALQAALAPDGGPAFFGYIYGPMLRVVVPAQAPPMFAAYALDDGLFGRQGFGIVESWHAAQRPVELHAYEGGDHAYERGDHGFGVGKTGTTSTLMLEEFTAWLESRGLLALPK
jgi:acetyl esterase/lipase